MKMNKTEQCKDELLRKWHQIGPPSPGSRFPEPQFPIKISSFAGKPLIIKDESNQRTGTYKDWHGWMMGKDYLQNHFPNPFFYYLASTGNAAVSDAVFSDELNKILGEELVTVVNFYPHQYSGKLLGPDSYGRFANSNEVRKFLLGKIKLLEVDYDEKVWSGKNCLDRMLREGFAVTPENSRDITEGFNPTYSRVMKEFAVQIRQEYARIPKTLLVVQFGAGMLYYDCKSVIEDRGWPIDIIGCTAGNPETIADKVHDYAGLWLNGHDKLVEEGQAIARKDDSLIHHVDDQSILRAMAHFGRIGIDAEPSGAAGLALFHKKPELVKGYDLIAVINTGNGIKNFV